VKIKEEKEKCELRGRHSNCYWVEVSKEQKRRREVKGRNSLDEEIEDDITIRKKDRGQLIKRKNPSLDAMEHRARRKERRLAKP
jgi:hypothetical protein